ncbi:MAG: hypothetical protein RIB60_09960 [Phycisphaerales bacterium]
MPAPRSRHPRRRRATHAPARCVAVLAACLLAGCAEEPAGTIGAEAEVSFGEVGRFPGQFSYPRAIDAVMTPEGPELYICDKTARVQRMLADGTPVGVVQMPEHELGKPTGLTVAAHPTKPGQRALWVADTHYHRVLVYDLPEGEPFGAEQVNPEPTEPLIAFGSYGHGDGEFIYPTDVAVLTDASGAIERVYVSEYGGNDRVCVFTPTTIGGAPSFEFAFAFGTPGTVEDAPTPDAVVFNRPQSLVIDPEANELIVADSCNHRLGRFTLEGELIAWVGGLGDAPGSFTYPYGIALLGGGQALVCEFGACRVQQIDLATGDSLGSFGGAGLGENTLAKPWGVALAGGMAWVLDSGRNRVVGFEAPTIDRRVMAGEARDD